MSLIGSATGSFFCRTQSKCFQIGLPMLGNDLRMWLNPKRISNDYQSGSNALLSITDHPSVGTTNINNTPNKGQRITKKLLCLITKPNEYSSIGSFCQVPNGNPLGLFQAPSKRPTTARIPIWSFDTHKHRTRDYAIVQVTCPA